MRFEFSIALKYLLPRVKQLSTSIIALVSVLVISLVVWLILVFLSVTDGLEKSWIEKLITLNAPLRVTPTEAYFNSYYYQVDSISEASDYRLKTISEKLTSSKGDPYDSEVDSELPSHWSPADRNPDGSIKDLAKLAFDSIASLQEKGVQASPFEIAVSQLQLQISNDTSKDKKGDNFISNLSYLASFQGNNKRLANTLLKLSEKDLNHLLLNLAPQEIQNQVLSPQTRERLKAFFTYVQVSHLKTSNQGLFVSQELLPLNHSLQVCFVNLADLLYYVVIPSHASDLAPIEKSYQQQGYQTQTGELILKKEGLFFSNQPLPEETRLLLAGNHLLPAHLIEASLEKANALSDLQFYIKYPLQKAHLEGVTSYKHLEIGKADILSHLNTPFQPSPLWLYQVKDNGEVSFQLPEDADLGHGILLTKNFKDNGALLGDRGFLNYYSQAGGSVQEQRSPVFVAGFYDPGIIPAAGRLVLVSPELTSLIRSSVAAPSQLTGTGIQVWFDDIPRAEEIKIKLQQAFEKAGIAAYWQIETFHEYDFAKDLVEQLHSDKNLFTLLALIIIVVACSNIISMLILLVNDKKKEIGILQSMGASSFSIALIFGLCGVIMGLLSSLAGTAAALFTLNHLQTLVGLLSQLQGHEAFNSMFYGETLPNQMSSQALTMVWIATSLISLLAGLVPAVKASLLRPSTILRSE